MNSFVFSILLALTVVNVNALPSTAQPYNFLREFIDNEPNRLAAIDVVKHYACFIDALEAASKSANLEDLWNVYEARFRSNIEKWGDCGDIQTGKGFLCHFQQAAVALLLSETYISKATDRNPIFYAVILPQYLRTCIWPNEQRSNQDLVDTAQRILACFINVTSEAIAGTEYDTLWKETVDILDVISGKIGDCRKLIDPYQISLCAAKYIINYTTVVEVFLSEVAKENLGLANQIIDKINLKCAMSFIQLKLLTNSTERSL